MTTTALILAAGKGKRMKSDLPKVLHPVAGKPMLARAISAARGAGADRVVVVVGHGASRIKEAFGESVEYVLQEEQLGTGHAVWQARDALKDSEHCLVLGGDMPLLEGPLLGELIERHQDEGAAATLLTARLRDPSGYGRVVRDPSGAFRRIVEDSDATDEERRIDEVNSGVYCFKVSLLYEILEGLGRDNAQGEYYLPDVLPELIGKGYKVAVLPAPDSESVLGINNRVQLAEVERILFRRRAEELMLSGVTIRDPASVYIGEDVEVGRDAVIEPMTYLEGRTVIARGATVGPNVRLVDTAVGSGSSVQFSVLLESRVGENCVIGPFAYLRPGTVLGDRVKVGDFVEVKNSTVGSGTKIPHLSYVGDADVGRDVNIGAGTIVVNYDGRKKHRSRIADGAFVGCNSNLVSPVEVGEGAYVAAGSTITRDVPGGSLGIARARQENKEDWARRYFAKENDDRGGKKAD